MLDRNITGYNFIVNQRIVIGCLNHPMTRTEGGQTMRIIMGVLIGHREHEALKVQELLTQYGCYIKTRLGLHDTPAEGTCSSKGLLLLEFLPGNEAEIDQFEAELQKLESIVVKRMEF
jgi:hypothetical protein